MNTILTIIQILIFLFLSILHFYWSLGGKWALANAAPSIEEGKPLFVPGKIASAAVGFGLFLFASFYALNDGIISFDLPSHLLSIIGWIIPAIFILRAIGEFKYVGFFKKVKNTGFGRLDTKIYSPLCLFIGLIGIWLMF